MTHTISEMELFLRLMLAVLPLLLAAGSASAQQAEYFYGGCHVHKGIEWRCAVNTSVAEERTFVATVSANGHARGTGKADFWISQCGTAGTKQGTLIITRPGKFQVASARAKGNVCGELYISDCTMFGSPASCLQAFANGTLGLTLVVQ